MLGKGLLATGLILGAVAAGEAVITAGAGAATAVVALGGGGGWWPLA